IRDFHVTGVQTCALPISLLRGAHHDGLHNVALLHAAAGDGVLHRGDDDVADPRVAPTRATEYPDAEDLLGTRVVGDLEPRLLLRSEERRVGTECASGRWQ